MNERKKGLIVIVAALLFVATHFWGYYRGRADGHGEMVPELDNLRGELQDVGNLLNIERTANRQLTEIVRDRDDRIMEGKNLITSLLSAVRYDRDTIGESRRINNENIRGMGEYLGISEEIEDSDPNPGNDSGD